MPACMRLAGPMATRHLTSVSQSTVLSVHRSRRTFLRASSCLRGSQVVGLAESIGCTRGRGLIKITF